MSEELFKEYTRDTERTLDYISEEGDVYWGYDSYVLKNIVETSHNAKNHIFDVLRKFPTWDERHLCVVLSDTHYSREVDVYGCEVFYSWLAGKIRDLYLGENYELYHALMDAMRFLISNENCQTYTSSISDECAEKVNSCLTQVSELKPEFKLRVAAGQKRSKAVSKICKALGLNEVDGWGTEFAHYGDAINPLSVTKWTIISGYVPDFLLASNGEDWTSCHNPMKIDKDGSRGDGYSGCYCGGSLSYAMDNTSLVMYTVDAAYSGDEFFMQLKHTRSMVYVHPSLESFIIMKAYPYGLETHFEEFKSVFEKVWSQCMDRPNLWDATNKIYPLNRAEENYKPVILADENYIGYMDWQHKEDLHGRYIHRKMCWLQGTEKPTNDNPFIVGAQAICIYCGEPLYESETISCCADYDGAGRSRCPHCNTRVDEDERVYSNFHDTDGCTECMVWNNWVGDYFFASDEESYVENIDEYVPYYYLEDSDEFRECEACGEWIYIGNPEFHEYVEIIDDATGEVFFYCTKCAHEIKTDPDAKHDDVAC